MKKIIKSLFVFLLLFFFAFSVASCGTEDQPNPVNPDPVNPDPVNPDPVNPDPVNPDPVDPTPVDPTPVDPYEGMSEEEKAVRMILDAIEINDYHVTYDGKGHNLQEAGYKKPTGGSLILGSKEKYTLPGTYPNKVTLRLNGYDRVCEVNLVIEKYKPTYTGVTESWVFLDERHDFDISFDVTGVELTEAINLTTTGDYKVTLNTKASDTMVPMDPVEVLVHVRDTHYSYNFESQTVVADGNSHSILLAEQGQPLDLNMFTVTYTNNENNVERGKYYITATLTEKATGLLYDEYRAILTIDVTDNTEFDAYVTEMFEYFFADNQLTINILIGDYAQFGLEHKEAKWYAFEPYSQEDYEHDVNEVKELRKEFNEFDKNTLSNRQLNDYELINENIKQYEALFADKAYIDMRLTYVDQYGGYCADLPSELEGFHLNSKEDLDDMIDLLNSIYDAFMSYYDSIEYRESLGYPLSEFTLTNFIKYLDGVVEAFESADGYYLANAINKSFALNDNMGLTLEERRAYATQITELMNTKVYAAHKDLRDKTQAYLDAAKAEGGYLADPNFDDRYLGQYEKGKELYTILLHNKLGMYDITPEEYIKQVNAWFKKYKNQWSSLSSGLTAKAKQISNGAVKIVENNDFQSLLAYLKEFAKTIVPDLDTDPKIDVIWMDPTTTENTTTAAYYMKSPLSSTDAEYIHMNQKSLGDDYLDTLSTLSHEGYPGHLYAYVRVKENANLSPFSTVSTNTTHGEGWATYVEIELANYIAESKKGQSDYADWKAAMDYSVAYDLMSYLLYTIVDYAVNYEGANGAEGVEEAISKAGLSMGSDDAYSNLFYSLNEQVAVYPAYGFGRAMMYQLHLDAQAELGEYYDVVDFNGMILEHGWCSMDRLLKYYDEYISDMKFLCGLA